MTPLLIAVFALLVPQIPTLLLPEGNGAWTVQVTTSGGILGTGDGNFALSSAGKIVCASESRCPKEFKVSDFQPLVAMIEPTLPVPPLAVITFCHDCLRRTITISRRDPTGVVQSYTASWDETTQGQVPEEVVRLYFAIRALMK
jgi:hypothetical protein